MIVVERSERDEQALAAAGERDLADDGADWTGVVVAKPWGRETQLHQAGALAVTRLELHAGAATSLHCHTVKRTQLNVERGDAVLCTIARQYPLAPGDCVHIEPGAFHRIATRDGCTLIEVESPPNKRDLVRLEDHYGREGKGYERVA